MTRQIDHTEASDGITYTLSIEKDDQSVRGNVSAIDRETDRKAEDFVYAQLRRGNLWAWCVVTVTASIQRDGVRFEGQDHLGACSYRNRQQFMQAGGYWEDMRREARLSLQAQLLRAATQGTIALEILNERFELALDRHRKENSNSPKRDPEMLSEVVEEGGIAEF